MEKPPLVFACFFICERNPYDSKLSRASNMLIIRGSRQARKRFESHSGL
jgi:hypothetical protein